MPDSHAVVLLKWTQDGIANYQHIKDDLSAAAEALRQEGGAFESTLFCMGQFDAVVVVSAPSQEVVQAFTLALSSAGGLRTTTLPVLRLDDMDPVVATALRLGEAYIGAGGRIYGR